MGEPYEDLDVWGHLNCNADEMATNFWLQMDSGEVVAITEGF
jgi:hypothetical protein